MRFFCILALLFLSCREVKEPKESWLMIFSDAQPVQFWPLDCNTYNQQESEGVYHRCFCQPWNCDDEIKIQGTDVSGDEFVLSVRDESGNELMQLPFESYNNGTTYVYNLSIIPSESSPELCDQKIQFVAINETSGTPISQSDCQDIQQSHDNTILVTYRNHRNVYGLVYADISPDLEFYIRIHAIFFHQRFPKEEETTALSTSLLSLNSVVRKQRLLDIDYVPYYFHEKLQLIMSHQFVTIYNREWVTQEEYEIVDGNRLWPIKKAKIYLSEKDFVQRNVL